VLQSLGCNLVIACLVVLYKPRGDRATLITRGGLTSTRVLNGGEYTLTRLQTTGSYKAACD
jgi:hypothetical protein